MNRYFKREVIIICKWISRILSSTKGGEVSRHFDFKFSLTFGIYMILLYIYHIQNGIEKAGRHNL